MRSVTTVVCALTAAASTWLGVMFVVLHRPGYERGLGISAVFVLQSLLAAAVINQWLERGWWRAMTLVGAAALALTGTSAIVSNLRGPHFEGYALVTGALLVLQGVLTILLLITSVFGPIVKSAPIRQLT